SRTRRTFPARPTPTTRIRVASTPSRWARACTTSCAGEATTWSRRRRGRWAGSAWWPGTSSPGCCPPPPALEAARPTRWVGEALTQREEASGLVVAEVHGRQRRLLLGAARPCLEAARAEAASAGRDEGGGHVDREDDPLPAALQPRTGRGEGTW